MTMARNLRFIFDVNLSFAFYVRTRQLRHKLYTTWCHSKSQADRRRMTTRLVYSHSYVDIFDKLGLESTCRRRT